MSKYDKTFNPNVLIGECELISRFSDFVLYLGTQYVLTYFMYNMIETFKPSVVISYSKLSWFSHFVLYNIKAKRCMSILLWVKSRVGPYV